MMTWRAAVVLALAGLLGRASSTGLVTGVVVTDDASPQPNRNARVYARPVDKDADNGRPIDTITDEHGRFSLSLTPGRYAIRAAKDGWPDVAYRANLTADAAAVTAVVAHADTSTTLALVLPRGAVITGAIRLLAGAPLEDQVVELRRQGIPFDADPPPIIRAMTNDLGEYRAFGLLAGAYIISTRPSTGADDRVFYPGVTTAREASAVVVSPGDERSGVDIVVATPAPASVAPVIAARANDGQQNADANGAPIAQATGAVSGSLTRAGQPAPAFGVVLVPADRERWTDAAWHPRLVWPDTDGHWEARGLPPGNWRAAVVASVTADLLTKTDTLDALVAAGAAVVIPAAGGAVLNLRADG
jgi:hypothetical protein